MARFRNEQVPEVVQAFWAALQAGEFITGAAAAAGTYRKQGTRWVAACGGVRPRRGRDLNGRCLTFAEREEIALARARGETMRTVARRLGRAPSTISRELARVYGENDIEWLEICSSFRAAGMPLAEIRRYAELVGQGPGNEAERLAVLRRQHDRVIKEIDALARSQRLIEYKLQIYEKRLRDGTADNLWTAAPVSSPA